MVAEDRRIGEVWITDPDIDTTKPRAKSTYSSEGVVMSRTGIESCPRIKYAYDGGTRRYEITEKASPTGIGIRNYGVRNMEYAV